MSSKILVAVDGSEGSKRALDAAASLAGISDSQIILAYVIDWSPYSFHTPQELEERHSRRESEIQRAHDSVLNPEVERMAAAGVKVETVVKHGKIASTLNSISTDSGASHIYIGRQGETGLKTMIFGSVTAALVQSSSVPVTVVP